MKREWRMLTVGLMTLAASANAIVGPTPVTPIGGGSRAVVVPGQPQLISRPSTALHSTSTSINYNLRINYRAVYNNYQPHYQPYYGHYYYHMAYYNYYMAYYSYWMAYYRYMHAYYHRPRRKSFALALSVGNFFNLGIASSRF